LLRFFLLGTSFTAGMTLSASEQNSAARRIDIPLEWMFWF
jgi:hypothetical protein